MVRLRTSLVCLVSVCSLLLGGQTAAGAASPGSAPRKVAELGPATNWKPDPGPHRGTLRPSPTALPHREPAATSQPLAAARPKAQPNATTSATYSAPTTPQRMIPGQQFTIPFTLTNTTANALTSSQYELSYHWTLPDGTDRTDSSN